MDIVKEVQERNQSSSSSSASNIPPPPTFSSRPTGFPEVQHRSKLSAFKKARQEAAAAGSSGSGGRGIGPSNGNNPPPVISSVPIIQRRPVDLNTPTSNSIQTLLTQASQENAKKVEGMSQEERERELEELRESLPGGGKLLDVLRRRLMSRNSGGDGDDSDKEEEGKSEVKADKVEESVTPMEVDSGEPDKPKVRFASTHPLLSLSPDSSLPSSIKPTRPALKSPYPSATFSEQQDSIPRGSDTEGEGPELSQNQGLGQPSTLSIPDVEMNTQPATPTPTTPTKKLTIGEAKEEDLLPSSIHQKYFPSEPSHPSALAWIQDRSGKSAVSSTSSNIGTGTGTRFDLSGNPIDLSKSRLGEGRNDEGLHHHGNSPDLAGYNLEEVLMLCRSTFGPQKVMMLGLLAKIIENLGSGSRPGKVLDEGLAEELLVDGKILEEGVKAGLGVIVDGERNVGVLREGIRCLISGVGLNWDENLDQQEYPYSEWQEEDVPTLTPEETDPRLLAKALLFSLPLKDLVPHLSKLLSSPLAYSSLDFSSIYALLSLLLASSRLSSELSDEVCPILPTLVENFVLTPDWPPKSKGRASEKEIELTVMVLEMVKLAVMGSRTSAKGLVSKGIFGGLLRFLAVPPWTWAAEEGEDSESAYKTSRLVLGIFERLLRYGLCGSLLLTGQETFRGVSAKIGTLSPPSILSKKGNKEIDKLVRAWFDLTRSWYVYATDPHGSEVEHDLIWSQVEGLGWVDEGLSLLEVIVPSAEDEGVDKNALEDLSAAVLDMVAAWLTGVTLNGIANGDEEKASVKARLLQLGLQKELQAGDRLESVLTEIRRHLRVPVKEVQSRLKECLATSATQDPGPIQARLAYSLLQSLDKTDGPLWALQALQVAQLFGPGDEENAMRLVDDVLDLNWPQDIVNAIGNRHGLHIVRPFLHYVIIPSLDELVGPAQPSPKFLKLSTTLRQPSRKELHTRKGNPLELSLSKDWLFTPLNELLRSKGSVAFKQLPPAWDASDLELVRATLTLVQLSASASFLDRSTLLFNLMKVFMLEQENAKTSQGSSEGEAFRDDVISALLSRLLKSACSSIASEDAKTSLETVAKQFLPPATPFYQFYSDFLTLYEAISFSDKTFGQLLLPVLAQSYPVDFRKAFWTEQTAAMRSVSVGFSDVPLETGDLSSFFVPVEADPDLLNAYLKALASRSIVQLRNPFLFALAVHHLSSFLWYGQNQVGLRASLIKSLRGLKELPAGKAILEHDGEAAKKDYTRSLEAAVSGEELSRRLKLLG